MPIKCNKQGNVLRIMVFKQHIYLASQQSVDYEHSLTLLLYCPCLCEYVIHFCDSMWSLRVEVNLCRLLTFGQICIAIVDPIIKGPGWLNELGSCITYQLMQAYHQYGARLCKLQKGCTRLTSDTVYQLLADGRWFSPGTPSSSTTKTGRHDIAEILLKVA